MLVSISILNRYSCLFHIPSSWNNVKTQLLRVQINTRTLLIILLSTLSKGFWFYLGIYDPEKTHEHNQDRLCQWVCKKPNAANEFIPIFWQIKPANFAEACLTITKRENKKIKMYTFPSPYYLIYIQLEQGN